MTIPSDYFDTPIKLVYIPDNQVIVKFPKGLKGKAEFSLELNIKKAMEDLGVPIPYEAQEKFQDRKVIKVNEEDFGIAFYQYYYVLNMDKDKFKWTKI